MSTHQSSEQPWMKELAHYSNLYDLHHPDILSHYKKQNEQTLLMFVIFNQPRDLENILKLDVDINLQRETDGMTPLMALCCVDEFGELNTNSHWIPEFIARGADVHGRCFPNEEGESWTALMVAVYQQNILAFKELIKAGANIDDQDIHGKTVMDLIDKSLKETPSDNGFQIKASLEALKLNQSLPDPAEKSKPKGFYL